MREARIVAGLSQEGLADVAGLHRTYIGDVERGERNIALKSVEKIADALRLDPREMFLPPGITAETWIAFPDMGEHHLEPEPDHYMEPRRGAGWSIRSEDTSDDTAGSDQNRPLRPRAAARQKSV